MAKEKNALTKEEKSAWCGAYQVPLVLDDVNILFNRYPILVGVGVRSLVVVLRCMIRCSTRLLARLVDLVADVDLLLQLPIGTLEVFNLAIKFLQKE